MELYSFFNSSTSQRVRIALQLKGVAHEYHGVNIRAGAHRDVYYLDNINPAGLVPAVVDGDFRLGQSLAIIDWLDTRYPEPRLIPVESEIRMRVLELSYLISCDMHPVNNLRMLKYLQDVLCATPTQKDAWYNHWIAQGMAGVEGLLVRAARTLDGPWCFGPQPTLADCCLVPQMSNARRMGCDLSAFPRSRAVYEYASKHPAFVAAQPDQQPDYIA